MSVLITGDIHGNVQRLVEMCDTYDLTDSDVVILLGDVGLNYYGGKEDEERKKIVADLPCNFFMIHGNHEKRPSRIPSYEIVDAYGAKAYWDKNYPNQYFAIDGQNYSIEDHQYFVIGGAYSVDKWYRLSRGWNWFDDEQPSEVIKAEVESNLHNLDNKVDIVLTHTCPYSWRPTELFLSSINQSTVDNSTERWLEEIKNRIKYNQWFFGHFHGEKHNNKYTMLFNNIVAIN